MPQRLSAERKGMSRVPLFQRSSYGALVFRLVWPAVILFALAFAALSFVASGTSDAAIRERLASVAMSGSVIAVLLLVLLVYYTRRLARELANNEERVQDLFGRDPLSSLPNRLLFTETARRRDSVGSAARKAASPCSSSTSTASRTSTTPTATRPATS